MGLPTPKGGCDLEPLEKVCIGSAWCCRHPISVQIEGAGEVKSAIKTMSPLLIYIRIYLSTLLGISLEKSTEEFQHVVRNNESCAL